MAGHHSFATPARFFVEARSAFVSDCTSEPSASMTFGFNSAERVEGETRGDSGTARRPGDIKLIEFIVLGYRESERGVVRPRRTHLHQRFCQTLGETLDRSQLPELIRENFGMRVLPSIEP